MQKSYPRCSPAEVPETTCLVREQLRQLFYTTGGLVMMVVIVMFDGDLD